MSSLRRVENKSGAVWRAYFRRQYGSWPALLLFFPEYIYGPEEAQRLAAGWLALWDATAPGSAEREGVAAEIRAERQRLAAVHGPLYRSTVRENTFCIGTYPQKKGNSPTFFIRLTFEGQTLVLTFASSRWGSAGQAWAQAEKARAQLLKMPGTERFAWVQEQRRLQGIGWENHDTAGDELGHKYPRVYLNGKGGRYESWYFWPHTTPRHAVMLRFPARIYGYKRAFEMANGWGRLWYEATPEGRELLFEKIREEAQRLKLAHRSRKK